MKKSLLTVFILTISLLIISKSDSLANDNIITDALILKQNTQMESFIQARNPQETILFMHDHIADNAEFQISFVNTFMNNDEKPQKIMMNKADYINSYVRGLNYIEDYKIDIETKKINISEDGTYAVTEETITEEGSMLNPHQPSAKGVSFKTHTNCTKLYKLKDGIALSDKAECSSETVKIGAV